MRTAIVALLLLSACEAKRPKDPPPAASSPLGTKSGSHVSGNNFQLDATADSCKAGAECTMTIKLVAAGGYHINKEYPYKFAASAAPNVQFLGKSDATTFTRAAGDFVEQGETTGLMTVRFKPAVAGESKIGGTYKFSVCSADQCQIEQEKIELAVPVL